MFFKKIHFAALLLLSIVVFPNTDAAQPAIFHRRKRGGELNAYLITQRMRLHKSEFDLAMAMIDINYDDANKALTELRSTKRFESRYSVLSKSLRDYLFASENKTEIEKVKPIANLLHPRLPKFFQRYVRFARNGGQFTSKYRSDGNDHMPVADSAPYQFTP